jgi:histidinol-phosphate aminotransferase
VKFNPNLKDIKPYEGGKPIELVVREFGIDPKDVVKLASNENPFGTSAMVVEAIKKASSDVFMYPDDSMLELKLALCDKFDIKQESIILGAGSDQVIFFAISAMAKPDFKILTAKTTFAMYDIYAKQAGATILKTPSHQHKLDEFLEIYKANLDLDIIFLCLPNNPLGECLTKSEVYSFLEQISSDTLVVIDGAYQDFAAYKDEAMKIDPSDLIERFPNTLYLGTFSKSYALGGLRVGYGIAQKPIMQNLYKMRPPFNVTSISLKAALASLKDEEFVKNTMQNNLNELKKFEDFAKENSIKYIDSYTNFITFLFDDDRSSNEISEILLKKGIIIRNLASYGVNGIRVTIGTSKQNSKFLEEFKKLVK